MLSLIAMPSGYHPDTVATPRRSSASCAGTARSTCGRHYFPLGQRAAGLRRHDAAGHVDAVAVDAQRRGDLGPASPRRAWRWARSFGRRARTSRRPACISRVNRNGRTFEYISGEDPTLGATLVVPVVDGIQQNVMAIAKHYLVNNQEDHRTTVNELVDEVTLMELYGKLLAAAAARTAGYMRVQSYQRQVRVREPAHVGRHAQRVVQLLGLRRERPGRDALHLARHLGGPRHRDAEGQVLHRGEDPRRHR